MGYYCFQMKTSNMLYFPEKYIYNKWFNKIAKKSYHIIHDKDKRPLSNKLYYELQDRPPNLDE